MADDATDDIMSLTDRIAFIGKAFRELQDQVVSYQQQHIASLTAATPEIMAPVPAAAVAVLPPGAPRARQPVGPSTLNGEP